MFNIFGKNDWYPVWSDVGTWEFTSLRFSGVISKERCIFEIFYSPSRKEYKLKTSGYAPKQNSLYKTSVEKLNEFIKNGHDSAN